MTTFVIPAESGWYIEWPPNEGPEVDRIIGWQITLSELGDFDTTVRPITKDGPEHPSSDQIHFEAP